MCARLALPYLKTSALAEVSLFGAIADDERAVEEGDEGNNTNFIEVEIGGGCEGVFRDALKECLEAGASSLSECVGQARAALKECQSGL